MAAGRGKKRAKETRKEKREARASISVKRLTPREKDKHARRERRKWDQQANAAREARAKVDKRAVAGRKNQLRDRTEALRRRPASPGSSASSAPLRQKPVRRIAESSDDEQQPALTLRRKQDIVKGLTQPQKMKSSASKVTNPTPKCKPINAAGLSNMPGKSVQADAISPYGATSSGARRSNRLAHVDADFKSLK